jgi:hypothetical protein
MLQRLPKNVFATALVACTLAFVGACASVPSFKPSKPLDQAPSLEEGLLLCNEYRLPAEPKRPVTLRPFLSCLDDLKDRFPAAAAGNVGFTTFRDEFHLLYGHLNDQNWTTRLGTEVEVAIHAVLRALWQGNRPTVTPLERDLALKNFPLTAKTLDAQQWNVASNATFDPKLEALKAGVASLTEGERLEERQAGQVGAAESSRVSELCSEYFRLKRETVYLSNLWRDQFDLALLAPQSPLSTSVREKYTRRLDGALRELEELRPKIADARAKESFRVLACRP